MKPSGCVRVEWSCLGTKVREKSGIGLALKLEVLELRSSCDAEGVTLLVKTTLSDSIKANSFNLDPEHSGGKLTVKKQSKQRHKFYKSMGSDFAFWDISYLLLMFVRSLGEVGMVSFRASLGLEEEAEDALRET